jgi:DNA invertase Pin-like site-specific DNA recombinase
MINYLILRPETYPQDRGTRPLIEEFEKLQVQWVFLQNPFGDTPQGKLLTQMQGMMAEYERAQIHERTRRGRLEKARRGEFMPWAYRCQGSRH